MIKVLEVLVSIKQGQWLEDPWKIQGLYNDQTFPRSLEDFFDPCWVERGSVLNRRRPLLDATA